MVFVPKDRKYIDQHSTKKRKDESSVHQVKNEQSDSMESTRINLKQLTNEVSSNKVNVPPPKKFQMITKNKNKPK